MELISKSKKLEKEIATIYKERNQDYIGDGILFYEKYFSAKYKVLWVLKEPYDDFDENGNPIGGNWHFRDAFVNKKKKQDFAKEGLPTFDPMFYIMYSINNDFIEWDKMPWSRNTPEMIDYFKTIAYINVKKTPGYTTSPDKVIFDAFDMNETILLAQINTYQPDLVIFGNTYKYFEKSIGISESNFNTDLQSLNWVKHENRIYISAYHPSHRKGSTGISKKQYINEIIEVASKQLNKSIDVI